MAEIEECPEPKRTVLYGHLGEVRFNEVMINDEIERLAHEYVEEGIIPLKY